MDDLTKQFTNLNLPNVPSSEDSFLVNGRDSPIKYTEEDYSLRCHTSDDVHQLETHSSFSILTCNVGHANYPERPRAWEKKCVITSTIKGLPADIYFVQECKWKYIKNHILAFKVKHQFNEIGIGNETRLLVNMNKFDVDIVDTGDINKARSGLGIELGRICASKLKFRFNSVIFLVMSYHADRNAVKNGNFLKFCSNLVKLLKCSIIIGGDFNQEQKHFEELLSQFDSPPHFYSPTQECVRGRSIDFFVASYGVKPSIHVHNVAEIPLNGKILGKDFKGAEGKLGSVKVGNVLDHLPVMGLVTLGNKNNEEEIKLVSVE